MNVIREISQLNDRELSLNIPLSASWHAAYLDSKTNQYIFVSGLHPELNEGDLIVVFSQCGEIIDCNLVRDRITGKSRGFAFLAYLNPLSTVLAIDNFNGARLLSLSLRVDHADKYRRPKSEKELDAKNKNLRPQDLIEFEIEEDEEYLKRKKIVWDFEKFGQNSSTAAVNWNSVSAELASREAGEKLHQFSSTDISQGLIEAESQSDERVKRIMDKMKEQMKCIQQEEAGTTYKQMPNKRSIQSANPVVAPSETLASSSAVTAAVIDESRHSRKHKKKKHKKEKSKKRKRSASRSASDSDDNDSRREGCSERESRRSS